MREVSIGLCFERAQQGGPFEVSEIIAGGAAERACLVRVGDELEEVAADCVRHLPVEVLRALLAWPPDCSNSARLVQLTLKRNMQLIHLNLQQQPPDSRARDHMAGAALSSHASRLLPKVNCPR